MSTYHEQSTLTMCDECWEKMKTFDVSSCSGDIETYYLKKSKYLDTICIKRSSYKYIFFRNKFVENLTSFDFLFLSIALTKCTYFRHSVIDAYCTYLCDCLQFIISITTKIWMSLINLTTIIFRRYYDFYFLS